jgi:PP-loop superfamily ATP-utilizing enzyme
VEVLPDQLEQVRERWTEVRAYFEELGFESVTLDAEGYRRGRMLSLLSAPPV